MRSKPRRTRPYRPQRFDRLEGRALLSAMTGMGPSLSSLPAGRVTPAAETNPPVPPVLVSTDPVPDPPGTATVVTLPPNDLPPVPGTPIPIIAPGQVIPIAVTNPNGATTLGTAADATPVARFVEGLYTGRLGRSPSAADVSFWSIVDRRFGDAFVTRQTAAAARSIASTSGTTTVLSSNPITVTSTTTFPTTTNTGSTPSRAYVDALDTDVLGRTPNAADEAFWVGVLDAGVSKATIRGAFLNTAAKLA